MTMYGCEYVYIYIAVKDSYPNKFRFLQQMLISLPLNTLALHAYAFRKRKAIRSIHGIFTLRFVHFSGKGGQI